MFLRGVVVVAEGFLECRGDTRRSGLRRFSDEVSVLDMENMSLVEEAEFLSLLWRMETALVLTLLALSVTSEVLGLAPIVDD